MLIELTEQERETINRWLREDLMQTLEYVQDNHAAMDDTDWEWQWSRLNCVLKLLGRSPYVNVEDLRKEVRETGGDSGVKDYDRKDPELGMQWSCWSLSEQDIDRQGQRQKCEVAQAFRERFEADIRAYWREELAEIVERVRQKHGRA